MFNTTPASSRVARGSQARVSSTRFSRSSRAASATRRSTPLHETLSVGLGLTQRPTFL